MIAEKVTPVFCRTFRASDLPSEFDVAIAAQKRACG